MLLLFPAIGLLYNEDLRLGRSIPQANTRRWPQPQRQAPRFILPKRLRSVNAFVGDIIDTQCIDSGSLRVIPIGCTPAWSTIGNAMHLTTWNFSAIRIASFPASVKAEA